MQSAAVCTPLDVWGSSTTAIVPSGDARPSSFLRAGHGDAENCSENSRGVQTAAAANVGSGLWARAGGRRSGTSSGGLSAGSGCADGRSEGRQAAANQRSRRSLQTAPYPGDMAALATRIGSMLASSFDSGCWLEVLPCLPREVVFFLRRPWAETCSSDAGSDGEVRTCSSGAASSTSDVRMPCSSVVDAAGGQQVSAWRPKSWFPRPASELSPASTNELWHKLIWHESSEFPTLL